MPESALHMVRLEIQAPKLVSFAGRDLPPRQDDTSFLVHRLLASLFGEGTVQPFRVLAEERRSLPVLSYSERDEEALRRHADSFADPLAHSAVDWSSFAVKSMPGRWKSGCRLGFEVKVCPIVRLASSREVDWLGERRTLPRGAEIDAFVHRRYLRGEDEATREGVYREWTARRLRPAAEVLTAGLQGFRRRKLVRKTHEAVRRPRLLERPEALVTGTLTVSEPQAFAKVLANGVGRHKAFGFGMLLLRPET